MFLGSNLIIFLTAMNREILELWRLLEIAYRVKANIFVVIMHFPKKAIHQLIIDMECFIKYSKISEILDFLKIDIEDVIEFVDQFRWTQTINYEFSKNYAEFFEGQWLDHCWYIRVFFLIAMIIFNMTLGYQNINKATKVKKLEKR